MQSKVKALPDQTGPERVRRVSWRLLRQDTPWSDPPGGGDGCPISVVVSDCGGSAARARYRRGPRNGQPRVRLSPKVALNASPVPSDCVASDSEWSREIWNFLLPAPDRRPADPELAGDLLRSNHRQNCGSGVVAGLSPRVTSRSAWAIRRREQIAVRPS